MDPASAAEVGWRTGQGILLKLEVTQGHHEPQLDRQRGQSVASEVKKGQLETRSADDSIKILEDRLVALYHKSELTEKALKKVIRHLCDKILCSKLIKKKKNFEG